MLAKPGNTTTNEEGSYPYTSLPMLPPYLRDIKKRLQLLDQQPFIIADIRPIKFFEGIDTRSTDERVKSIFFLKVAAVGRLVTAHLDLHGNRWLALFADLYLLMVTLDASTIAVSECFNQVRTERLTLCLS